MHTTWTMQTRGSNFPHTYARIFSKFSTNNLTVTGSTGGKMHDLKNTHQRLSLRCTFIYLSHVPLNLCKKGGWKHCFVQGDDFLLAFFVHLEKTKRIAIDDFQISDFLLDRFLFLLLAFAEPHCLLLLEHNFLISLRSFLLTHTHSNTKQARSSVCLLFCCRSLEGWRSKWGLGQTTHDRT